MDNWNQLENGRGSADTISLLQEDTLPAVTLRGLTILPGMVIHFDLSRETSMSSVEQAMLGDQRLLVVSQKDPGKEEPGMEDIYDVGTVTLIRQVSKLPEHVLRVLVEGVSRARIHGLSRTANGIMTQVSYERDDRSDIDEITAEAMTRTVKEALEAYGACFPKVGKAVQDQIEEGMELGKLLDSITINMPLPIADKQKILSAISVRERFSILTEILTREVEVIRIKSDLAKNIRQRIDKNQRDYILREQMQYIKEELEPMYGKGDNTSFSYGYEEISYTDTDYWFASPKTAALEDGIIATCQRDLDKDGFDELLLLYTAGSKGSGNGQNRIGLKVYSEKDGAVAEVGGLEHIDCFSGYNSEEYMIGLKDLGDKRLIYTQSDREVYTWADGGSPEIRLYQYDGSSLKETY